MGKTLVPQIAYQIIDHRNNMTCWEKNLIILLWDRNTYAYCKNNFMYIVIASIIHELKYPMH